MDDVGEKLYIYTYQRELFIAGIRTFSLYNINHYLRKVLLMMIKVDGVFMYTRIHSNIIQTKQ